MRLRRPALVLAVVGGCLIFLGFCGCDQFYLEWVALVPVLWALDDDSLSHKEAIGIAWLFGFVAHLGAYTWITGMLMDFGYLPWPLAILVYALLCLAQSVLFAVWGYGVWRLKVGHRVSMVWSTPVMMVIAEWLVPQLFPSYLANSQYRQIYFIQSAEIWGPLGLTFILTMFSGLVYETLAWRCRRRGRAPVFAAAVFLGLFAANLAYGYVAVANIDDTVAHTDTRLKVGIVQVNMGIYEKDDNPAEGTRRHREQSLELEAQKVDLIVWPESGYNYGIADSTKNVARQVLGPVTTPLIFGAVRIANGPKGREPYNSAFLVDGDGTVLGTYDKTYLLAFGEYLPFGDWLPILYRWSPHTSHFRRGTHTKPLTLNGVSYGLLICYEDILPGFVRQVMDHEPQVLVNVTNDAWFGKSREPRIHLALALFRAVEHRRFLVRATNTGISAFVDPVGRILSETPIFARANLVETITPLSGRTLYASYGDWVAVLSVALLMWWARQVVVRRLRRG
ncbi:MAG: apolipoprotein N-acyltransferase [Deltaproteobacteria bacterium]|nr:apolipoprotein N-acyltransferase [Deltaproteobacteria bacterium]